jgi:hypothetical protein
VAAAVVFAYRTGLMSRLGRFARRRCSCRRRRRNGGSPGSTGCRPCRGDALGVRP